MNGLQYKFQFQDKHSEILRVVPIADENQRAEAPEWTRLEFHQCPNCPLRSDAHPHCPMALQMVELVNMASRLQSYDAVTIQVEDGERGIQKTTTLQRGVGSVMGLLAAISGCPRTAFLRPMAHFHLPFSSETETVYRVASMYLLAQYLRAQQGLAADWQLNELKQHYEQLHTVNVAMASRLRAISKLDGAINALVLLDLLAMAMPYSVDEALQELKPIFASYLTTER